jgi:hypothetical protein
MALSNIDTTTGDYHFHHSRIEERKRPRTIGADDKVKAAVITVGPSFARFADKSIPINPDVQDPDV